MNGKQIVIVAAAVVGLALIILHDLPIEFPGVLVKMLLLFVKVFIVIGLTVAACILAGGKKRRPSAKE